MEEQTGKGLQTNADSREEALARPARRRFGFRSTALIGTFILFVPYTLHSAMARKESRRRNRAWRATSYFTAPDDATHVVGRRLALSPAAVFPTLGLWGWMWGIVGAIVAVPMLASFKLLYEQIELLNPIAEFLTVRHG